MLNFFKKPNVNTKFIQSYSHNIIKVDTKYGNLYLLKHDESSEVKVDFIKIDIEGMEHLAIKGGAHLIKKQRPFLLIELIKTDHIPILKIFGELNYKAYLINNENGLFIPNEYDLPIKNLKKIL